MGRVLCFLTSLVFLLALRPIQTGLMVLGCCVDCKQKEPKNRRGHSVQAVTTRNHPGLRSEI